MKYCFYVLFLLVSSLAVRAQTAYKDFEVDSAARPIGGIALLEKFIEVNRRMPYSAEVSRIKGIVILSGVIEPNGTVSEIKTLRSLRPDCDREAMRVLSLFKAWKPALKGGQPVRQQFTYPVRFAPSLAKSEPGARTAYYTNDGEQTGDESQALFRLVTPVDTMGIPNGNPVFSKREGAKWQQALENTFERKPYTVTNEDDPALPDSITGYRLVIKDILLQLDGTIYSFYPDGTLLAREQYATGQRVGESVHYYPNGMVKRVTEYPAKDQTREWVWYPNGMLRQVSERKIVAMTGEDNQLLSQWDAAGNQVVQNGNGKASFVSRQDDRWITETGAVKETRKEGTWQGQYADGKPAYRESYQGGKCISGVAYYGQDSVAYQEPLQHPEFDGGLSGLSRFLSTNLHYPEYAARANIQGKVFVSFVVCEDGSLCDYDILKSVHSTVDKEALRVVKASNGKWKPGSIRGRRVRVKYNLPLNFALQ
ncbi:TonB family protein [Larkinella sp.]|uniref:TonB family protein n=1 Tax=Larkinella sp. TaxID=2034517 RepID=UPI003BA95C34